MGYLFLPAIEDEKFPESLLRGQTNATTHNGGMYSKEDGQTAEQSCRCKPTAETVKPQKQVWGSAAYLTDQLCFQF